ncbi:MAG: hypothetical protein P8J32_02040, partial [bacterium]|nr:hypothetical protein [bacterium]
GMAHLGTTVPGNSIDTTKTSNSTSSRPWATAIVFKADIHNSNQHIWNYGEGGSSGDDNIYLRLTSGGQLLFGWGRDGTGYNECEITQYVGISSSAWYGVYVAHKGVRYNANNATAANLADIFDIRLLSSYDSFASVGSNLSTSSRWTNVGYRMDRSITSHLTIGGRSANRSFHGKVASMVVTTLLNDSDMPTDNEIKTIVTDPMKWLQDFKIGNEYRIPSYYLPQASFGANGLDESTATQIWLMGDGTYDSYSNGIRGQVRPAEQNYTKLQLNSMVSNDIENVTISGLS